MTKVKVFDNFGKEIRNNSLICIVGEKNCFNFDYIGIGKDKLKIEFNKDKA